MIIAVKISTKNDVSGNPRRLYIVSEVNGNPHFTQRLDVIDEVYEGSAALRSRYPDAIVLQEIEVPPSEYRKWIKVGKNDEKLRG